MIKEKLENKCHTLLSSKIDHELNYLNFNFSHCGTKYLKETIMEVYKIRDDFNGNLEKNIFPILAQKYSKSVNTIYCNIKNEVKNMTISCDETLLNQYFGSYFFIQPKVNDVIFTILNKIIKNLAI